MIELTQKYLKSILHYDPETGIWTWLIQSLGKDRIGKEAGSFDKNGYIQIKINQKTYLAHRLAFLYMTGSFPENKVDHEDLNKSNNRWNNIRKATDIQNAQNKPVMRSSKTGFKGVHITTSGKYQARIKVNGKYKNLGSFKTVEEAYNTYVKAADELHGEFAQY